MRPYSLYLVEDHPVVRESYTLLLGLEDDLAVCGEAATAAEALREVPALAPDLVLVDVSLPDMNGLDLVAALRAARPEQAVLVVSGHAGAEYAQSARDAGACGYLAKHRVADDLVGTIREALAGAAALATSRAS